MSKPGRKPKDNKKADNQNMNAQNIIEAAKNDVLEAQEVNNQILDKEVKEKAKAPNTVVVKMMHPGGAIFRLPGGKRVTLNGCNSSIQGMKFTGPMRVGEMGTTVISGDEWEAIKANYSNMEMFKNGLIFAETDPERANDKAKERQKQLRHGLEPVKVEDTQTTPGKPTH